MYGDIVRSPVVVVALSLGTACLFPDVSALTSSSGDGGDAAPDAPKLDTGVDAGKMCDPTKPFGAPRKLSEIADGNSQYNPTLTADELDIWWGESVPVGDAGYVSHVMHATRSSITATFGTPSIESGIDNGGPVDPNLSDDGLTIMFVKSGSVGGFDLFRATRTKLGDPFGSGIQLPSNVLSTGDEISPFQTPDGSLYFRATDPARGSTSRNRSATTRGARRWSSPSSRLPPVKAASRSRTTDCGSTSRRTAWTSARQAKPTSFSPTAPPHPTLSDRSRTSPRSTRRATTARSSSRATTVASMANRATHSGWRRRRPEM
jgi:hypothetical protein